MHGAQTTTAVVFSSAFVTRSSASATRLEHYFFSRWFFFWSRLFCEEAKGPFFFFFRFFCLSLVFFVKKKTPAFSFSPKKKRISSRLRSLLETTTFTTTTLDDDESPHPKAFLHQSKKHSRTVPMTSATVRGRKDAGTVNSWDAFWRDAVEENERKMRDANKAHFKKTGDENFANDGDMSDAAYAQKCLELDRGVPRNAIYLSCSGCGCEKKKEIMMQLECAQCLEMYKERKMKVVMDAFERAFFCSKECFVEHWTEHRMRHGPAYSRATKENGEVHRFEAHDEGCGALWDHGLLKRMYFHECEPNTKWDNDDTKKKEEREDEEDAVDSDKENEETF